MSARSPRAPTKRLRARPHPAEAKGPLRPKRPRAAGAPGAPAVGHPQIPTSAHVENHEAFAALASHARYQILDALAAHPKTIRELTKELGVHRLTLRYHLGFLVTEGFVEEVPATHQGKAGRPPAYYRTARHALIPGFPPRRFEFIAQASLAALLEALGEGDARQRLYAKGKTVGAGVVRGIAAQKGILTWTPALFDEHILKGSYREMGVSTEVLAATPRSIEYRAYGCPFLELAEQMPDVVCDALDTGFHDGVDEALGPASTVRLRCLGHGDPFCEYAVTWGPKRPRPAAPAEPTTADSKETSP